MVRRDIDDAIRRAAAERARSEGVHTVAQELRVSPHTVRDWMQKFKGTPQSPAAASSVDSLDVSKPEGSEVDDIGTKQTTASRIQAGHVVSLDGGTDWGAVVAADALDDDTVVLMIDYEGEPVQREVLGPQNAVLRIDAEPYEFHPAGLQPEVMRFQADGGCVVTVEGRGRSWRLTCPECPDIEESPSTRRSAIWAAHAHASSHRGL